MAWLNNQRIKHEDCQTKHKTVMHLFIEKFGCNLVLPDDPDPGIDYTLYNVEDFLEDQQKEEQK
ncbi:hypothetical protein GYMLUDRAFT_253280 [Collybiopsis luxurians FD-317 M1]|uniref:Unplaced genomic scaffold GYMLUscaffold_183, whole genome shotgun sequence n=1 Tax=Collybiopsis luxurians FD-317 M1 TaxID=944289 RepID=A0A0D0BKY9_9AGAR|nr:hypothetical protein GYMLUDRAFT_253280 [Collybiopsis luxurians FD-317 M1]